MTEILKQRDWTEEELYEAGFQYYERIKQIVMARVLPEAEAPLTIVLNEFETVEVEAGYVICYEPGQFLRARLNDYPHWPVHPDIFDRSYTVWNEPGWQASVPEKHLRRYGCKPYYKSEGAWAKEALEPTPVQSLESKQPILVPVGQWLLISPWGEPWYVDAATFYARYTRPEVDA